MSQFFLIANYHITHNSILTETLQDEIDVQKKEEKKET